MAPFFGEQNRALQARELSPRDWKIFGGDWKLCLAIKLLHGFLFFFQDTYLVCTTYLHSASTICHSSRPGLIISQYFHFV